MERDKERKDILICGVNGFTAQKLLEYIIEQRSNLQLGVTCRSKEKLERTMQEVRGKCKNHKYLDSTSTHILGVDNLNKLTDVIKQYKVVINCIGPFANSGLQVVEACIRARTHYVDCTGEPGFMEDSYQMFKDKAKDAGIMVVHACGFDSMPLDLGMVYTMKEIEKRKGISAKAESYMQLVNSRINLGTFKTIISSLDSLKKRKTKKALEPQTKEKPKTKPESTAPKDKVRKLPFYSTKTRMYAVIFPGSDSYVLRKTRAAIGNQYPICHCYISVPTLIGVFFLLALCLLIGLVYLMPVFIRNMIYEIIDILTFGKVRKEGPTDEEIMCSGFQTRIFVTGQDSEGQSFSFNTLVSGPDPGYVTTPITLLVAAETILAHSEDTLKGLGGVFTPGSLFSKTDIIDRLIKEQLMFCIVPKSTTLA
ncbi:hypothetical protein NEOKW01_0594 [Nematocida sp. AWRm80]|nr:hypothetical protein NEOKW01_0594 [Nematocida sp. AWRm80]